MIALSRMLVWWPGLDKEKPQSKIVTLVRKITENPDKHLCILASGPQDHG